MATLIVLQGPDKGRTLRTTADDVLLGRGSPQIPLTDQTISRRHAELRVIDGAWTLVDLGSANGTYVNGVRIDKPLGLRMAIRFASAARCSSTPATNPHSSSPAPGFQPTS